MVSDTVILALIVAIPAMLSPLLLAWLTNRNRASEKAEDYARQDAVASKAEEAAGLLKKNNEDVAKSAEETKAQLSVIHTLVNSNMTTEMQKNLTSTQATLVVLQELTELRRSTNKPPKKETSDAIASVKAQITELEAALADRLKQSKAIEQAQNEKVIEAIKKG